MPTFSYSKNQIHPAQLPTIKMLVDLIDAKKIIEIGSWVGESTSHWATAIKHKEGGKVFSVDWFKGNSGTDLEPIAQGENIYAMFNNNMVELGLREYINVFYMKSSDAAKFVKDGYADIVYIDASHDYESIKRDIFEWTPKVRKGGIICGHDCEDSVWDDAYINVDVHDHKHHGVIKAVHEAFPNCNITERIWWQIL